MVDSKKAIKCAGRDSVERTFLYSLIDDGLGGGAEMHFMVETVAPCGEHFDFAVSQLDGGTLRVIMMHNHGHPEYKAMGIAEAMIAEIAGRFGKTVVSSPSWPDEAGVFRTPEATKVWERLRSRALAVYDKTADVYTYVG